MNTAKSQLLVCGDVLSPFRKTGVERYLFLNPDKVGTLSGLQDFLNVIFLKADTLTRHTIPKNLTARKILKSLPNEKIPLELGIRKNG